MTEAEFSAMEPREQDAAVAVARGWVWFRLINMGDVAGSFVSLIDPKRLVAETMVVVDDPEQYIPHKMAHYQVQPFTTDLSTAWDLVDELETDGFWFSLVRRTEHVQDPDPTWVASFRCVWGGTRGDYEAMGDTVPLAICIASLRAKGAIEG